jgi:DNA-binding transcriptional MerR regulator
MRRITTDDGLRIGELAERAGLTIRTLHHYDQIGLVRASERTAVGRRRYPTSTSDGCTRLVCSP